jgi:hypothetical protein
MDLNKFHTIQNITNKLINRPHLRTLHVFSKLVQLGNQQSHCKPQENMSTTARLKVKKGIETVISGETSGG